MSINFEVVSQLLQSIGSWSVTFVPLQDGVSGVKMEPNSLIFLPTTLEKIRRGVAKNYKKSENESCTNFSFLSWKTLPHLKNLFLSLSLRTQTESPFFFRSPRLLRSRLCLSSKSEQNEPQRLCFLTPDLTEKEQSERQWE